ncbi:MAG: redoxin domain-containing protein [Oscillospiraceae bacterium]|nr:redoxin domain-containing protein [Oscillospiraceae bacterium]
MKRKLALMLAVLLLLSAGCAQMPEHDPAGETTHSATEPANVTTQPTTPGKPQPTQTQAPTEPTQSATVQPTQPTQPMVTEQPAASTQPTQPNQPAAPTQPTQATRPMASTQPTQPPQITEPTQPTQPAQTQATTSATEMPTDTGCQHIYQQTNTKAATCTAAGSKKFVCSKCGTVMRQEIPAKGHSYNAATCISPRTCRDCSHTEGAALGHSYGENHLCIRCGAKDPNVSPDAAGVDFVATIRSDEGVPLTGITVTVSTDTETKSGTTDQSGKAKIPLHAGSSQYTVTLSGVPQEYQVQATYSFHNPQVTINLKTLPVRTDPNDHSKARYEEGDKMMDFTITDVDGNTYQLSRLLKENKLVILDFWYVSCNPCKQEFPYFEAALDAYGEDVVLLAVDPFYSAEDIRELRDEMELTFPVFQDPLGLSGGFRVESYPTTVFIDSTGTIRKIHRGAFSDEDSFLRAVAAYL